MVKEFLLDLQLIEACRRDSLLTNKTIAFSAHTKPILAIVCETAKPSLVVLVAESYPRVAVLLDVGVLTVSVAGIDSECALFLLSCLLLDRLQVLGHLHRSSFLFRNAR